MCVFFVHPQIYEIGGGSGTCAKGIMDYIMLNAPTRVYKTMTYTYVVFAAFFLYHEMINIFCCLHQAEISF